MNNIKILEYSIKNREEFLDPYYIFVDKHLDLSLYANQTKKIKNKLIAIKEVRDKNGNGNILGQLFGDLQNLMDDYSNFSEFGCFINACDSKRDEVRNNTQLLKKITKLYLDNRDLNDIVPSEWIQALIDKTTSRKKGHVGEEKLIDILKKKGYLLVDKILDFDKNKDLVAKFSSKGDFTNKKINNKFGTSLGKKTQGKKLDLIIKKGKDVYFLEAKHISNEGGEQNKQILELIEIVRIKPKSSNHHFISFLDGIYFNKLFDAKSGKMGKQSKDIKNSLKKNKNNYFLNTTGFKKIF